MNPKFFQLPEEKQQHIINAAYKVFAGNSYKKAPMSEIADECGISKALLFHYFENKKELYLFLWKQAEELTGNAVREFGVMDTTDFFEILEKNLRVKCSLTRVSEGCGFGADVSGNFVDDGRLSVPEIPHAGC